MTRSTARRRKALSVAPSPSGVGVTGGCLAVLVLWLMGLIAFLGMIAAVVAVVRWAWGA